MRKAFALASAAAVLSFGAAACSDDTEDPGGGEEPIEEPLEEAPTGS